jgi:imidazolonepropionase-like amidohydrolase
MKEALLLLVLAVLASCTASPARSQASPELVLRGVTLIDGTGAPTRADVDLLIEGGRIIAIQQTGSAAYPDQARVMDLPGRFVMPGLIDTHAHVTILFFHREGDGSMRTEYRRDLSERVLRLLLAHGVTTVRNPSAPAEAGVALRDDVARGDIPGPRILTSGEHLDDQRMSEAEIRAEVRRQVEVGVDMIKVYSSLRPAQVHAAIEEAHSLGVPVVGHLHRTTWTEAARLGIDAITHGASWATAYLPAERRPHHTSAGGFMRARLDWLEWLDLDGPEITEKIRELAERRIPVDPTLITYHTKFFGDDPRWTEHLGQVLVPEISARWREGRTHVANWKPEDFARARSLWPKVEELLRRYHEAGLLLSAGSDLPQAWTIPGVSLHEELELLAAAGIQPLDVLTIATRNGAETLGLLDEIGTIEVGKRADLVVLSADPTIDIRNTRSIEIVVQGGTILRPQEMLDAGAYSQGPHPSDPSWPVATRPPTNESLARGIGVVAFAESPGGGTGRTHLLPIHARPDASSRVVATFALHDHSGSTWSYDLQADPPARSNAVEFDYEEKGLPFDSLAGSWARALYGWRADGPHLRGWVQLDPARTRHLLWADILQRYHLVWPDPAAARFYDAPEGSLMDLLVTSSSGVRADYDLEPLETRGEWMRVRVTVPSTCAGEQPSAEHLAWIRYLDSDGHPLLWPLTRGC